ncbi:uncharacterized protein TM35_000441510 [Trypanosoma theileri]|uniref:Uncharacterized protein n=1 Tax=Trypanosoma theileri TaxID=67003 RepID=A0A1X0NIE1_9TRYP|nr:uncharacterized protein TM35_000441510 [Trypanosoma theileri]ORC84495.1 hypothetical protein TM35_000441510 [Trypanosoma theileri]
MSDSLAFFLVTIELILFFAFDFLFARVLNTLKQDHPELEECAPEDSPDLDPVAVIDSLRHTVVEVYEHHQQHYTQVPQQANSTPANVEEVEVRPISYVRENALHTTVVICGVVAPVLTVLQFLLPSGFHWCRFDPPPWLQFTGVVPGLAAVMVFAARAMHAGSLMEVSRQQWITLMWFRLDFMLIAAGVALIGAGAWLVALCMSAVALYLAHRVMRIERRLARLTRETRLVRGEVDVQHVYAPGTVEAQRALASSDVEGYNALK